MQRLKFNSSASIIVVDVIIKAKTSIAARMVLDTGASFVVISSRLTTALGVTIDPKKNIKTATATKIESTPLILIPEMSLLGKTAKNIKAIVKDLPPQSGVDGLLGLSFLKDFKMTIEFKKGILTLE